MLKKLAEKNKIIRTITHSISFFIKEIDEARIITNAATITLFVFISIFPLLMVLMTLLPLTPVTLFDVLGLLERAVPDEIFPLLRMIVEDIYAKSMHSSSLPITVLLTLWTASSGVSWLVRGVNDVYRRHEKRFWLTNRLFSLIYTLIFVLVIVVTLISIVFGHSIQTYLTAHFASVAKWESKLVLFRNLFALAVIDIFVTLVYQVFPRNRTFFFYQLPGAVFATAGWYAFSSAYSFYLRSISNYSYTYGSLAAIVSMIIWMFICINIILIGGEINYLWSRYRQDKSEKKQKTEKLGLTTDDSVIK